MVIAFIGIVNMLALSVLKWLQESGLLHAIGMTRGELRTAIRWKTTIIALLDTMLGLIIEVFFKWTLIRALHRQGVTEFNMPVKTLRLFVLSTTMAAVITAVLPGQKTARVDILQAIATE